LFFQKVPFEKTSKDYKNKLKYNSGSYTKKRRGFTMDQEQRIKDLEQTVSELKAQLRETEFRQDLLFFKSAVNDMLYEYKILKKQYDQIMDVMDNYRTLIDHNKPVSHGKFEQEIYEIVPQHKGNYHFVEYLTAAFKEEGRWDEVFDKLYGDMPKYKNKG
jgi:hypothetical protein